MTFSLQLLGFTLSPKQIKRNVETVKNEYVKLPVNNDVRVISNNTEGPLKRNKTSDKRDFNYDDKAQQN